MGTKQPTKEMVIKNQKQQWTLGEWGKTGSNASPRDNGKSEKKRSNNHNGKTDKTRKATVKQTYNWSWKNTKTFWKRMPHNIFEKHQRLTRWSEQCSGGDQVGEKNQPLKLFSKKITATIDQRHPCRPWGQKRNDFVSEKLKLRTTINSGQSA